MQREDKLYQNLWAFEVYLSTTIVREAPKLLTPILYNIFSPSSRAAISLVPSVGRSPDRPYLWRVNVCKTPRNPFCSAGIRYGKQGKKEGGKEEKRFD